MKNFKLILPATIAVCFCLLSAKSFAQSPKQKALTTISDAFYTRFVRTPVVTGEAKLIYSFDYEITDSCILILRKAGDNPDDITWVSLSYEKINYISQTEKSGYFQKITGLKMSSRSYFKSGYGRVNGQREKLSVSAIILPFIIAKDDTVVSSLINAVNIIVKEIRKEQKLASARSVTDKLFLSAVQLKQVAYYQLPQYEVFTADSVNVKLASYLETNRLYKDKPTLLITWSYKWCKPCMRIIDSLLNSGAASEYNIALVSRDKEMFDDELQMGFAELKGYISKRTPDYNKSAIVLFDRNDKLADWDNGEMPLFTWLDKNLMIIGSYSGLEITTGKIRAILSEIHDGKIKFAFLRYYDAYGLPCSKSSAYKSVDMGILASDNNLYQLGVYSVADNKLTAVALYRKDETGRFIRQEKK